MTADKGIKTISHPCEAIIVVKSSKFIAHASAVAGRDEAESFIAAMSQRFHDATHNCFAYRTGLGEQTVFRFSDDGEPSGTAGRPILQAITAKDLTNVVVVVTRYFGGTKLGTGGLMRAYRDATVAVLSRANLKRYYPISRLRITFSYQHNNTVHWLVTKFSGDITEKHGSEKLNYHIRLKSVNVEDFCRELRNQLKGDVEVEIAD